MHTNVTCAPTTGRLVGGVSLGPALCALGLLFSVGAGSTGAASAQDSSGSVFLAGENVTWGPPQNGTRFLPLYGDLEAEGEVFAFRLEVQDGFELGPHTHPVTEHLTILSGRLFVGLGDIFDRRSARGFGPGSYVAIAAGAAAYMWAEGETVVQVHGVGPLTTQFVELSAPGTSW